MSPLVSVVMPLYNKADFVAKAVQSVCAQTFSDWELIIVNDGSTDHSVDIVTPFLQKYEEKIFLYSQQNAGVAVARNNGIEHAHGRYLCFLDADDWWCPIFLERIVFLSQQYTDAGLFASNYVYYKVGKIGTAVHNLVWRDKNLEHPQSGYLNYPMTYVNNHKMPIWTGAVMIPKNVFHEVGGFIDGVHLGEDFLLWSRISVKYPIAYIDEPLAYYNNDVPVSLRATRHLHAPERHMLFHLDLLEQLLNQCDETTRVEWQRLLGKLRASGLLAYWMDKRYHDLAAVELRKIDWSLLPSSLQHPYSLPTGWLKLKQHILKFGSFCKQQLLRLAALCK